MSASTSSHTSPSERRPVRTVCVANRLLQEFVRTLRLTRSSSSCSSGLTRSPRMVRGLLEAGERLEQDHVRHRREGGLDAGEELLVITVRVPCAKVDEGVGEVGQGALDRVGLERLPVGEPPERPVVAHTPYLLCAIVTLLEEVGPADKIEGHVPAPRPFCQEVGDAGLAGRDRPDQNDL